MVSGNARATVQMLADTDRLSADGERGEFQRRGGHMECWNVCQLFYSAFLFQ